MSGSPLKQFLLTLAGILLLGILLFSFTRPQKRTEEQLGNAQSSAHTPSGNISAFLTIKYAHKPSDLRISLKNAESDTPIYQGIPDGMSLEETIDIPQNMLEKNPLTIIVQATWQDGTPDTPISITLEPDGLQSRSSTHWSTGTSLHNTYLFSW